MCSLIYICLQSIKYCVALKKAITEFDKKKADGNATDKTMFSLGWTIDELSRLNSKGQDVYVNTVTAMESINGGNVRVESLSRTLFLLKQDMKELVKGISRHKRKAATHVLVTMISPSDRNRKPYAMPICCIPYVGLSESQAREHINTVVREMVARNMKVAGTYIMVKVCVNLIHTWNASGLIGFVSNGEYNVFRYKGYTRPLSVFQLRSLARNKFRNMGLKKMKGMLTPKGV